MSVLITSGGTKVWIDSVRYLGNFSKGGFGIKLSFSFLKILRRVWEAKRPTDFDGVLHDIPDHIWHLRTDSKKLKTYDVLQSHLYTDCEFDDFYDYAAKLENWLRTKPIRLAFLAAAVSDFEPEQKVKGKISSNDGLPTKWKKLPKLITQCRDWADRGGQESSFIQVGFKLCSDITVDEMIGVAKDANIKTNSDFTVANLLETVKEKQHRIYLVSKHDVTEFDVRDQEHVDIFVKALLEKINFQDWLAYA